MGLTGYATKDGNISINNIVYELKSKQFFVWVPVFVNNVTKNSDGTWKITATAGPITETGVVTNDLLNVIEKNLGKDEIILKGEKNTRKLVKKTVNENIMKLNISQLENIVKKVIQEQENQRYMFFSNLEQIKRQCELLLNEDSEVIESILDDGHDWAQDHIAEAKNNMDQVFDFLMNQTKKEGKELSMDINDKDMMSEGRKKTGTKLCARGLAAAKGKFKVHPSAYSNGYGVLVCKGKQPGLDGKKKCSPPYC